MKSTKVLFSQLIGCAAISLCALVSGCQNGGGFGADHPDPLGPAAVGVPSPGVGAPGGQSIDTRGSGSVAGSEGDNTLTNTPTQMNPANAAH